MDLKEVRIWNIKYNLLTEFEIAEIVDKWISEGRKGIHLTGVNGDIVARAQDDALLKQAIMESDIVNIDSMMPAFFLKRAGYKLKGRASTPDVLEEFFKKANAKRQKMFFLGAKQETLDRLKGVLEKEYPNIIIAGMQNGYYKKEDEDKVFNMISKAEPDYLFIALPSPGKEHFILNNKKKLNVGVFYGVGGALDAKSGVLKRPPKWLRGYGMEGILRMLRRPKAYATRMPLTFKFLKVVRSEKKRASHD